MRFNCGDPAARLRARHKREADKRAADAKWHLVFAWWPKRVGDSECVWLEHYERRIEWTHGRYDWYPHVYEVRSLI